MKVSVNQINVGDYIIRFPESIVKILYLKKESNCTIIMGEVVKRGKYLCTCNNCIHRTYCDLYHETLPHLISFVTNNKLVCAIYFNNSFVERIPKLKALLLSNE